MNGWFSDEVLFSLGIISARASVRGVDGALGVQDFKNRPPKRGVDLKGKFRFDPLLLNPGNFAHFSVTKFGALESFPTVPPTSSGSQGFS
jgi:hypothetical protein